MARTGDGTASRDETDSSVSEAWVLPLSSASPVGVGAAAAVEARLPVGETVADAEDDAVVDDDDLVPLRSGMSQSPLMVVILVKGVISTSFLPQLTYGARWMTSLVWSKMAVGVGETG